MSRMISVITFMFGCSTPAPMLYISPAVPRSKTVSRAEQ